MNKTVLITGSSSGIGKASALYFQKRGWNVSATMRNPEKNKDFKSFPNVITPQLDVTEEKSISGAIKETIDRFGSIDVVVNNAGYGMIGPLETIPMEDVRKQFEVNLFGLISVTKEILPYFRERKSGTIVNISSMGGRITFPFYSLYHSTKWAVEGLSESLWFELKKIGIMVKIVEPGAINTDFYSRSMQMSDNNIEEYKKYSDRMLSASRNTGKFGVSPNLVAKVVYSAANSKTFKLRYTAFGGSWIMLTLRKILPEALFRFIIEKTIL